MMSNSKNFNLMIREIGRLRKSLLPRFWHVTGDYSEMIRDRTRAFRVLTHAEIESYIENTILDLVDFKEAEWKKKLKVNYVISCLLIASKFGWQDDEGLESGALPIRISTHETNKDSIFTIIGETVGLFKKSIIQKNNGIKRADLKKMLFPIGISIEKFDPTWINNMESFGENRGDTAHTSRIGIKKLPDPKSDFDALQALLPGLNDLDKEIELLRKK